MIQGGWEMKFYCRYWHTVNLIAAGISGICLLLFWSRMDVLQRILLINFIVILFHQFEEYAFPGGEPAITNLTTFPQETDKFVDRYPLNQFSAMFGNVFVSVLFYLLPVFFPKQIWMGLAPCLFGMGQFIVHGIKTNISLHTFYNPGLAAVVIGHIPCGIAYIHYASDQNLLSGKTWVITIIYLLFFIACFGVLTYKILPDKNSKWPFAEDEFDRFHVRERLEKMGK